ILVERIENGRGLARTWTIIKGQDDFAGAQDDVGCGGNFQRAARKRPVGKNALGDSLIQLRGRDYPGAAGLDGIAILESKRTNVIGNADGFGATSQSGG